jgi:hypothetical protein
MLLARTNPAPNELHGQAQLRMPAHSGCAAEKPNSLIRVFTLSSWNVNKGVPFTAQNRQCLQ